MNAIAAVVIGMSIVLAAVIFAFVGNLLQDTEFDPNAGKLDRLTQQLAQQDSEIRGLRSELNALKGRVSDVDGRVTELEKTPRLDPAQTAPVISPQGGQAPDPSPHFTDQFGGMAPQEEEENLTEPMQLAKKRFNENVIRPTPAVLRQILGEPRSTYSTTCEPITNPKLLNALETRNIGHVRLTMIRPALDLAAADHGAPPERGARYLCCNRDRGRALCTLCAGVSEVGVLTCVGGGGRPETKEEPRQHGRQQHAIRARGPRGILQ
ncbi:hypothetical protein U8P69_36500 (plasmid) [Rhizobium beringeri]|nr:hypothetical protein U8P69_36500 [Rhizobium beringeri]